MADSLRFKGAKSVTQHTGTEMRLTRPKRGGDTHQVLQWWGVKHRALYVDAAIFEVTTDFGTVNLVLPVDPETTELRIIHDGSGNFSFPYNRAIDRVAVYSTDMTTFYKEYQFSRISGGPLLTRTVTAYPPAATSIGTVTISGPTAATQGTASASFSAAISGTAGNLIYSWSSSDGSATFSNVNGASTTVTFSAAGTPTVSCQVSSGDGAVTDSPQSGTSAAVTVAASFATRAANATLSYTVTVVNTAAEGDPEVNVYALNGVNQQAVALNVGESVAFDFSAVSSNHPLGLFTDSSKSTPVTVGVEYGGTNNATLLFTPVVAATLSYQCINHANMGGTITVS